MLVSTDILAEGVHFNLGYAPLKHLGYKSVVVNLSDIVAMNATPSQILVSIAASNRFPVEAFDELYAGIELACKRYNVDLVGGDTTSSQSGLVISITAIGFENEENIIKRSGAKPNDLLVVTGDLGGAYMGLQILEREHQVFLVNPNMQPEMDGYDYILERQLKPEARTDIKTKLADLGIKPTAMIDISDGLASEILHISEQSKVGFRLYEEKIPMDELTIMTAEEFINNITHEIFKEAYDYYFKALPTPIVGNDKSWVDSKELYHSLSERQRLQMQTFTKLVIQDVVSILLGKIDNISSFANQDGLFELSINGNVINGDLQDYFLMSMDKLKM